MIRSVVTSALEPLTWANGDTRFVRFTDRGGVGKTAIAVHVATTLAARVWLAPEDPVLAEHDPANPLAAH